MRYALLVCDVENVELSADDIEQRFVDYSAAQAGMEANGAFVSRERLRPTSASTTVRIRDGNVVIADGPFAESKEQIAGFYIIECEGLAEAIEMASTIPAARSGTVEVRPVWEM